MHPYSFPECDTYDESVRPTEDVIRSQKSGRWHEPRSGQTSTFTLHYKGHCHFFKLLSATSTFPCGGSSSVLYSELTAGKASFILAPARPLQTDSLSSRQQVTRATVSPHVAAQLVGFWCKRSSSGFSSSSSSLELWKGCLNRGPTSSSATKGPVYTATP